MRQLHSPFFSFEIRPNNFIKKTNVTRSRLFGRIAKKGSLHLEIHNNIIMLFRPEMGFTSFNSHELMNRKTSKEVISDLHGFISLSITVLMIPDYPLLTIEVSCLHMFSYRNLNSA